LAAGLGAATLLMAGLIALVQTDIKRVIAYSTMSQIGYMFLGAGLGAYANGMFHLMTHAFFKALLFLAAGIIIHALAGEQDMRRMGGLRSLMPGAWLAFWIGGLIQFAGVWTPISDFLRPVAPPLVEASGAQEAISSIFAVGFGIAGIVVAWYVYSAKREPAPKPWPPLEKKLYFDELYDALF